MINLDHFNKATAQINIRTIIPVVVHKVCEWDAIAALKWTPGTKLKKKDIPIDFLRELLTENGTEETYHVLLWAALQSREVFNNMLAEPALMRAYAENANEELSHNLVDIIFDRN